MSGNSIAGPHTGAYGVGEAIIYRHCPFGKAVDMICTSSNVPS
jgi:hypothetical protein